MPGAFLLCGDVFLGQFRFLDRPPIFIGINSAKPINPILDRSKAKWRDLRWDGGRAGFDGACVRWLAWVAHGVGGLGCWLACRPSTAQDDMGVVDVG
jgi:hypothetical protein